MNKSTSQIQQKEIIVSGTAQQLSESPQQALLASQANSNSYEKEPVSNYTPDSLWSNLRYGLGMLAVILIPPLIPGASVPLLIMGYMGVIVTIYVLLAIARAIIIYRPTKWPKKKGGVAESIITKTRTQPC